MKKTPLLAFLLALLLFSCKKEEPQPDQPQKPVDYRDQFTGTFYCERTYNTYSGGMYTYNTFADTVLIKTDSASTRSIYIDNELFFLTTTYKIVSSSDTTASLPDSPSGQFFWSGDTLKFSFHDYDQWIGGSTYTNLNGYRK